MADKRPIFCACMLMLTACSGVPPEGGGLYTYVDAQGNVVTLERKAEPAQQPQAQGEGGGTDEQYQTDEEVQAALEARDRNRFVTYMGPEGELVTQPVDLVAEREHEAARDPGYQSVNEQPEFFERILGVPANCCAHTLAQARTLEAGSELLVDIPGSEATLSLDAPRPGVTLKLGAKVATLRLRGFVGKQGAFVAPGLAFLDDDARPVLLVDRPYQRRFPETWYRYAFFEGDVAVPPEAAYVSLFLPYAVREGESGVAVVPGIQHTYDPPPALAGELTIYASQAR